MLETEIRIDENTPELYVDNRRQSRLIGRSTLPDDLAINKTVILEKADVNILMVQSPEFTCTHGMNTLSMSTDAFLALPSPRRERTESTGQPSRM